MKYLNINKVDELINNNVRGVDIINELYSNTLSLDLTERQQRYVDSIITENEEYIIDTIEPFKALYLITNKARVYNLRSYKPVQAVINGNKKKSLMMISHNYNNYTEKYGWDEIDVDEIISFYNQVNYPYAISKYKYKN